jgi:hypothetical protein
MDLQALVRDLTPGERSRARDALKRIEARGANRGKELLALAREWLDRA